MKDNKSYEINPPTKQEIKEFENFLQKYKHFDPKNGKPTNPEKCKNCIYKNLCDVSLA